MEYFLHLPPQYISIIQLVYIYRASQKKICGVNWMYFPLEKRRINWPQKNPIKLLQKIFCILELPFFYRRRRFAVTSRTTTFTTTTKSNLVKYAGAAAAGWWSKSPSKKPSYWSTGFWEVGQPPMQKRLGIFLSVALTMTFWWFSCVFSNCRLINAFSLVFVLTEEPFPFY